MTEEERDRLKLETLKHRAYNLMVKINQVGKKLDTIAAQLARNKEEEA